MSKEKRDVPQGATLYVYEIIFKGWHLGKRPSLLKVLDKKRPSSYFKIACFSSYSVILMQGGLLLTF